MVVVYVWIFYYFFVGPYGFRWRAIYGDAKYPSGYEIRGIDISHYQGEIDWEQLQHAMIEKCPIRFIMIKATEGSSRLDPNFNENFRNARDYGFIRGAYHFWSNKSSARDQAQFFLKRVPGRKLQRVIHRVDFPFRVFLSQVLMVLHCNRPVLFLLVFHFHVPLSNIFNILFLK